MAQDHSNIANDQWNQPCLTADCPGIGGRIKMSPNDFIVEELPLYPASGQGNHIYGLMEKRGLATLDALTLLAQALNVPRQAIGFAGLKDAQALTRQWISIEGSTQEKLKNITLPGVRILKTNRHSNKIKLGHLAGNQFQIKIRRFTLPADAALERMNTVLSVLAQRGTPNYFGPQRFGNRRDSHLLGYALLKGNNDEYVNRFLGMANETDEPAVIQARRLFDKGLYQQALHAWPKQFHQQRRALQAMIQNGGSKKTVYQIPDTGLKRFLISAYQSFLFNQVLAKRLPNIDTLMNGDVAYKHANGSCFRVSDAAKEQARCDAWEISPSGPIFGYKMIQPSGAPAGIENEVFSQSGITDRDFRKMAQYQVRAERRPLRYVPRHVTCRAGRDTRGDFVELACVLEPGCYATALLREIMKTDMAGVL